MRKTYIPPEAEVVWVHNEDIISTSDNETTILPIGEI